ncbi:MAG: hypothetical protein K2Y29_00535, partial [Beijerinckiaceae bacterium]|nr:hypothetical protein [Beijerinckiaceae bacterium]
DRVLPGWWLYQLRDDRTPTRFAGDTHKPTGKFYCAIQSTRGGELSEGIGQSRARAILFAILTVKLREARS